MNVLKASFILPPYRDSTVTTVTTTVRLYTAVTTNETNALPADWRGKYIRIQCEGGTVDYVLSLDSAQTVDNTVAATSAGAATSTLGTRLSSGDTDWIVVPRPPGDAAVYLARQADVSTARLRITLGSP